MSYKLYVIIYYESRGVILKNIEMLNFKEIVFCMIIAFLILILIKTFLLFKKLSRESEYPIKVFHSMTKDFYLMFPKQAIMYKGNIYRRGMIIKVTTLHKKIYEGEFVGFNGKDMICIITQTSIVTNNIKNIKDIVLIKQ